jgi:hypothetical protein
MSEENFSLAERIEIVPVHLKMKCISTFYLKIGALQHHFGCRGLQLVVVVAAAAVAAVVAAAAAAAAVAVAAMVAAAAAGAAAAAVPQWHEAQCWGRRSESQPPSPKNVQD